MRHEEVLARTAVILARRFPLSFSAEEIAKQMEREKIENHPTMRRDKLHISQRLNVTPRQIGVAINDLERMGVAERHKGSRQDATEQVILARGLGGRLTAR